MLKLLSVKLLNSTAYGALRCDRCFAMQATLQLYTNHRSVDLHFTVLRSISGAYFMLHFFLKLLLTF